MDIKSSKGIKTDPMSSRVTRLFDRYPPSQDDLRLDRRGSFQAETVTLWSDHDGLGIGNEATLVGTRPGNVLVVMADFALNQGERLVLDKPIRLEGRTSRAACHVVSSRPAMRTGDQSRASYILELQRQRA